MTRKLRWLCASLVLAPLLAFMTLHILHVPSRGVVHLSTIRGEATIIYESEYGIPYINGTTNEAVAYALGYAHAEDRLYDLQLKRALAAGRVSEVLFVLYKMELDVRQGRA